MVNDFLSNILNLLLLIPGLSAVVVVLLPEKQPRLVQWTAFGLSLVPLFIAVGIFYSIQGAEPNADGYFYAFQGEWFPELGAGWHVGVDGISMAMILLTALLVPLATLIAFEHKDEGLKGILALILFLEMAMFGVFMALDMIIFFLFWELGLVPMYFMINQWGGANRQYASIKFFIFTMAASLGLLLAIQLIGFSIGGEVAYQQAIAQGQTLEEADAARDDARPNFDIPTWTRIWANYEGHPNEEGDNKILGVDPLWVKNMAFFAFFLAFAVKIPIWPFHTWLPDAHTEAPTAGSMLLAGVLLKQGAYGFIRLVIPLFPREFSQPYEFLGIDQLPYNWAGILAFLSMLGIVLGAFAAWAQDDLKKLVAYSSVNHMGFVGMGIAVTALVYGTIWAQSPAGANDPFLALQMANQELEDSDIADYRDELTLAPEVSSLSELTRTQQEEMARLKVERELKLAFTEAGDEYRNNSPQNAVNALNGAVLQMFNHGLSSAGMFLLVGALYHKAHTRDLRRFGGLWHTIPVFAGIFVFTSLASLGLPGLNGFTGEWLIVAGAFPVFPVLMVISMVGLLMTGAYILKGIQKVLHGPPNHEWQHYHEHHHSLEISLRETWAIAPLVALMLITGLYPNWILPVINDSVHTLLTVFGG